MNARSATNAMGARHTPAQEGRRRSTSTSSRSSATPARARRSAASRSARSPRAWATACGPWRSSRPRSSRRRAASPAPAATASASARSASPTAATRPTSSIAFNEQVLLGRVRAGELKPGCIILLESMWRGRAPTRRSRARTSKRWTAARGRLPRPRGADGARVPQARRRPAQGQEHVRAGDAVQHLQPRPGPRARPDRVHLRQEGREGHQDERGAARGRATPGPSTTSTSSSASRPCAPPSRRS